MPKTPKKERRWIITAGNFNFIVPENDYKEVMGIYDKAADIDFSKAFISFSELSKDDAKITVRMDQITRFTTALFSPEDL